MKLLFEQNLSPKLASFFSLTYKGSKHLTEISLDNVTDSIVWGYAKNMDFTIVTKDNDFNNLVTLFGFPPKVIWIRRGNCSTSEIKELLNANTEKITAFIDDSINGILTFY
jgi:predicted nuclease of predicted toxin-antitoxin system